MVERECREIYRRALVGFLMLSESYETRGNSLSTLTTEERVAVDGAELHLHAETARI